MKFPSAIASALLLIHFSIFAQIPSDKYLGIYFSETNSSGILSNTQPDVSYEFQYKQGKTNWISEGFVYGSELTNWTPFELRITNAVNSRTIRVRSWIDSLGVGIPDWWQLKYFGSVGIDAYGNPEGDGWVNIQKFQNNMDPFQWYPPPGPKLNVQFFGGANGDRNGSAVLSWQAANGPVPDYFLIERANRTLRPVTNNPYSQLPPGARFGAFGTNRPPFDPRFGMRGTNRLPPGIGPGAFGTNRPLPSQFGFNGGNLPPNFRPQYGRFPGSPREDPLVTGPFAEIARIPGQPGLKDYRYVETNVDTFFQPVYRMQAHYSPPLHARLDQVDTTSIRATIRPVTSLRTTNGYALTVRNPIPYGRYLLLVRDKNDPQWRASGYFVSGTNRDPVHLQVDKKGMMSSGQSPLAMPEMRFLPEVVEPEFTAGWGEDSDGDGLPDIYEVLVTQTDPNNADTGDTGTLDAEKEMSGDGWSNLEKFRCRVDPTRLARPPVPIELQQPTGLEIMEAMTPKTDLHCELEIDIRTNGGTAFQRIEQVPWMLSKILNFRPPNDRRNFDLRLSWQFSHRQTLPGELLPRGGAPSYYEAIMPLVQKINVQIAETFKANLARNPPLSRTAASNLTVAIMNASHNGELDQGAAMAELMSLRDNQSQDFYGRVIDQHGQPVVGADVTLNINLTIGHGDSQKTQTDANGLFQFIGIRGQSVSVVPEKKGYLIEGHGLGLKGQDGPETDPSNRAVYIMWKAKGAEPMIHDQKRYDLKPDNRIYTLDLLARKMTEGTNESGDLLVQIERPAQVEQTKPHENFDWSFVMTAIGGGLIEVTNDDYLNEAPTTGYQPEFKLTMAADTRWHGWDAEKTFYMKSRDGKAYGHFHIRVFPVSRNGSSLEIESYVNPAGSRNLEFDAAKQAEYPPPAIPASKPPETVTPKLPGTNLAVVSPPPIESNRVAIPIYRCVTIAGSQTKGATDGTNGAALFNQPWGIASGKEGFLYVTEWGNSTIRRLDPIGTNWVVSTIAGVAGKEGANDGINTDARLNHPHGIAIDDKGTLYVADTFNHTIRKITHVRGNWITTTIAGKAGTFGSADGTNFDARFNNPGDITIDRFGNLYVSDAEDNTIRKLTRSGTNWVVTTVAGLGAYTGDGHFRRQVWGSADGTNSNARFFGPFGVAVNSQNELYVVDYGNNTIRRIIQSGTNWVVTTIAGLANQSGYIDGDGQAARFSSPHAITIDRADNIYVSDPGTDTIRLIQKVGTNFVVSTVIGKPWRWGYADGTNDVAEFNTASGITTDAIGNIYLADTGNNSIRRIIPPSFIGHSVLSSRAFMAIAVVLCAIPLGLAFLIFFRLIQKSAN